MEGYDYDEAAGAINIEDITSDDTNRQILRSLKENDPDLLEVVVVHKSGDFRVGNYYYCPQNARDFGWLGYFIGKSTNLKKLYLWSNPFQLFISNAVELFCRGVNSNRSVLRIYFYKMELSGGEIFRLLGPFLENNSNLSELGVEECTLGPGCAR